MSDDVDERTFSMIREQIKTLDVSMNRRIDDFERNANRRLTNQDDALRDIKKQTTATNGRVTALELARERSLGIIFAFKWAPPLLTAVVTAGLTVLIMVLSGGIH